MKHPASEPGNGGVTYREGCSSGDGRRSLMKSAPDPPMTLGNAAKAPRLIVRCWSYGPRRAGPQRACGAARPSCRTSRLALLLAVAAISPLGIALGQTAPSSPIVSDLPVASGTERVLFLGAQEARALVVLLPGSDGIIGLDSGGGVHQLGGNFLVRTIGQWVTQGFDVVLPDAPNGTSLPDIAAWHRARTNRAELADRQRFTCRQRDRAGALPRSSGSPRTGGLASR
jgi:hypothetical protein